MSIIECDTKKIHTCGEDIVSLSEDFEAIIENLFSNIMKLETDEIWVGDDAQKYIQNVVKDKDMYINLYNELKKLGIHFQESADKLEETIRKVKLN